MAHFAQIDETGTVIFITTISNDIITDANGVEQENLGIQHILNTIPNAENYTWKKTSYNSNFRKTYAGVGYIYIENLDVFLPPKPAESWTLDEETISWKPPVEYPNDGNDYEWNESELNWTLIVDDETLDV